jgi:hypothetical protein
MNSQNVGAIVVAGKSEPANARGDFDMPTEAPIQALNVDELLDLRRAAHWVGEPRAVLTHVRVWVKTRRALVKRLDPGYVARSRPV